MRLENRHTGEVLRSGAPHLALRHRHSQTVLVMPPAVQAILFRVVVAFGTVLGRYRGTEWPGCPARCTGAPWM